MERSHSNAPSLRRSGRPRISRSPANVDGEQTGRQRVLQRARELFVERGYASVSMQQIADAAGLRKASIYHHFKDKNALFVSVMITEMEQLRSEFEHVAARRGGVRSLLEELAYAHFSRMESADVSRLIREFRQHIPKSEHDEIHSELGRLQSVMERVFESAADEGLTLTIDSRIAGLFFFHMMSAWIFHSTDDPTLAVVDPRRAAQTVTSALLDGILK